MRISTWIACVSATLLAIAAITYNQAIGSEKKSDSNHDAKQATDQARRNRTHGARKSTPRAGQPPATPLQVVPNTPLADPALAVFSKKVMVFDIPVYATSTVSDAKTLHAAAILAEYLDNDEDGQPDAPPVVDMLRQRGAAMILFADEEELEESGLEEEMPETLHPQPLFAFEIIPQGAAQGEFDASLEEVLHLITSEGLHWLDRNNFGEVKGSRLGDAMDEARAAGAYHPEANEPGLPYEIQASEYLYWALTSILGGQQYEGRLEEIQAEWSLNTKAKMEATNPLGHSLFTDPELPLPRVLPDGAYTPEPPSSAVPTGHLEALAAMGAMLLATALLKARP